MSRSVTPGAWYGVLGDDVVVLLPPMAKARVAGLWERVDEGAGFDVVLDALISGGLRELPGFVLASTDGGDVKVVIRGAGEAELTTADGHVIVTGADDTTWVERNVSGVTAMTLRVADVDGAAYAVGPGLVRVATVSSSSDAEEEATPHEVETGPLGPPVDAPTAAPHPDPEPEPEREPERERELEPEPEPGPASPAVVAPVPVPVPVPVPESAPAVPPSAPELGGGGLAQDRAQAQDDDDTQTGTPVVLPPPPEGTPPAAAPVTSRPVARLIFSSGEVVDVDRAVLVGRAPEATRYDSDDETHVVTVPSPHQEISSTHLEIRPGAGADHGTAVVTDLGSTNGTIVLQPGLPPDDLQPGIAVQLIPGAVVDLGEGVTIQVTTV